MRALNDCIKEDKSEADKMFKELKFKKLESPVMNYFEYTQNVKKGETAVISFDKGTKTIMPALYVEGVFNSRGLAITPKEVQAIYEKCKEL